MKEMVVVPEKSGKNPYEITGEQRLRQIDIEKQEEAERREREKKSIYKDFIQLNCQPIDNIVDLLTKSPLATAILLFILKNMNKMNALVCSYAVLVEHFGKSRQTISKAVALLKERGFIYVYKAGTTNVYCVNPQVAWKNHGDKYRYCKFPAEVMLTISEQTNDVKYEQMKMIFTEESEQE